MVLWFVFFFFSSRRRHTRWNCDWCSDVCSSDLRLLDSKVRQSNVVARYGGDEFVILMPETGVEQAQILSERLRLWIRTDTMLNEHHITGSFGVASFPVH